MLEDIEKLGKRGDLKETNKGYARNFLIPKNLAVLATESEVEKLEEQKELEAQEAEEELLRYQEIAEQMDGLELEIPVKIGEEDKLFGAITPVLIVEKLKERGFEIDKNQIKLEEPIKELGEREVMIELPHNLEVGIKIIVLEEKKKEKK